MSANSSFEAEAQLLLCERILQLRGLSLAEVSALPKSDMSEIVVIAGHRCQLTVFVQSVPVGTLVVAQLAKPGIFGTTSFHHERGLVFSKDGSIREASEHELLVTGG